MSLLYKEFEELEYSVIIKTLDSGEINFLFWDNGGKFGTHEILDEFNLTPLELLEILQKSDDR
jgi:hypothetical protein